jgi:Flp pilus assembly protein TadD
LQKADFDAAIAQFQSALKATPQDPTLHYDLGLALKLKDQLADAIVELQKAAELDPQQPDIHYTLGVTFWQQGKFDEAANELQAAIRAKPDYAEAHYTLGTVLKQQGKLQEAATSLREAIRLQPDFAGAHTTLATILHQLGDEEGAARERLLGAQISKDKTSLQAATFNTNSGKRLLGLGDIEGAISQFQAAISLAPSYAPAHFHLAEALQRKGQAVEAQREFKRAAELDPQLKPPSP